MALYVLTVHLYYNAVNGLVIICSRCGINYCKDHCGIYTSSLIWSTIETTMETREIEMQSIGSIPNQEQSQFDSDTDNDGIEYPEGGFKAYCVLLGSFLGLVVEFGLINSIGVIQTYVATHQLSDAKASTVSWIFSVFLALSYGLTPLAGYYFDLKGPHYPLMVGTVLIFAGLMGAANSTQIWQFILALSIGVGAGISICCPPLIGVIGHWFFKNIGLAIGVSSTGGSVGGIFIPLMLRSLYGKLGFVWTIRILAFVTLACNLLAIVLVRTRVSSSEKPINQQADNISVSNTDHIKIQNVIENSRNFLNVKAFKDKKFSFLSAGVFFGELGLMLIVTYYGTFAIAQGIPENESYLLLTAYNCCGILGRWIPGYLADKLGYFNLMVSMLTGSFVTIFIFWIPLGYSRTFIYIFILLFGFFSASILSLSPACTRQISPVKEFGSRYGLMYFFVSFSYIFGFPLATAIIDDETRYSYNMFAVFCGFMLFLSAGLWAVSRYLLVGMKFNIKV